MKVGCKGVLITRTCYPDASNFFVFFEIIIFCFVVAICDLVHDVEIIFHLSYLLTASGNLF